MDKKTKVMKVAIVIGILILPLIYSIVYLGGFWDPYGNLEGVPVALVNEDNCDKNCKGEELVNKLTDAATFKFDVVSKKKAEEGLFDKKYYAVITIPSDFTDSFDKASTKERHEAVITYCPNKKTSYLASQIINTAMTKVQGELRSEVSKQVVSNLTDNLKSVPEQTKQIANGLNTISTGVNTLDEGALALKNGASALNTSYKAFDGGINELTLGISNLQSNYKNLDDGINKLYDNVHNILIPSVTQNMNDLNSGVTNLKSASDTISNGLQNSDYKNQINSFMDNTNAVYTALAQMCSAGQLNNQQLCGVALGYTSVADNGNTNLQNLKDGTNKFIYGQENISAGINLLSSKMSGVSALVNGVNSLDANLLKIKNGSNSVYGGINKLNEGASSLSSNSAKVSDGINTLDSSLTTLKSGTSDLNSGVNKAKDEVNSKISETESSVEQLDGLDDYAANSVKIKEKDYGKVDQYGTFFAPYFMSLSLWIGGILILIGLYYDPDGRFKLLGRNTNNRGLRLLIYNGIGILQALILGFVLKVSMGFTVTNIFLYYGSCILISISFLAIVMFLFFTFKDVGKFLAIVLLVLQLAASAGTFPVETEPAFYQAIYPFMPMHYSIELLRESFVNIDHVIIGRDVTILVCIFVVFGGLTLLNGYIKSKKENSEEVKVK